jgi:pyridoxal biosynthesis lyase PdxS
MTASSSPLTGTSRVKRSIVAEMLKGALMMDVVNVERARIAEDAAAIWSATTSMKSDPHRLAEWLVGDIR